MQLKRISVMSLKRKGVAKMTRTIALGPLLCFVLLGLDTLTSSGVHASDEPLLTAVEPKNGVTTPGSKVAVYGSGFSPDAIIYFGGLQARETRFMDPSRLETVTPYLRPGSYQLQ